MLDKLRQSIKGFPETIPPRYTTASPNAEIKLYEGEFQIEQESGMYSEEGSVYIAWLPTPNTNYHVSSLEHVFHTDQETKLAIPALNLKEDVILRNITIGNKSSHCFGSFSDAVVTGVRVQPVEDIIFHVPNFPDFQGELIRNAEITGSWRGRARFIGKEWTLTLDRVINGDKLTQILKQEGGFVITHVGKIERNDRSGVDFDTAQELTHQIGYFLSFLSGLWSLPVLSSGSVADTTYWNNWQIPRITPWRYVRTWFPYRTSEDIKGVGQVFYGFMEKCDDPLWHDSIISAIHWYIEANLNAGAVEGAIILTCTALELLGWTHLVNSTGLLTPRKFDKNKAEDNLRSLLTYMQVPTQIPASLKDLQNSSFNDGPQALMELRNRIVHPPSKPGQQYITQYPFEVRQQGRDLGIWYLEVVLLWLFGYGGPYYQRFRGGFPSDLRINVPWNP